jgi:hypothetical protein
MANSVSDNLTQWVAQRDQRIQLGDALEQSRQIDHVAYFRSRNAAARAASTLESHGFSVSQARSGFRTAVSASRDDALTDASVAAFLNLIVPIVEENGGKYDGFGGGVVV